MLTLARQFPMLSFARRAEKWLERVAQENEDVFWQLEDRRISGIGVCPLFSWGGLAPTADKRKFWAYWNVDCAPEKGFWVLGQNVGYTFCFNLKKELLKPAINKDSPRLVYHVIDGSPQGSWLADFANRFADRWTAINTVEKVRQWCCASPTLLSATLLMLSDARE